MGSSLAPMLPKIGKIKNSGNLQNLILTKEKPGVLQPWKEIFMPQKTGKPPGSMNFWTPKWEFAEVPEYWRKYKMPGKLNIMYFPSPSQMRMLSLIHISEP